MLFNYPPREVEGGGDHPDLFGNSRFGSYFPLQILAFETPSLSKFQIILLRVGMDIF